MHNRDAQAGFALFEVLVAVVVLVAIGAAVWAFVGAHPYPGPTNSDSEFVSYKLPYTSDSFSDAILPRENTIMTTVSEGEIRLHFQPNRPVGDIYTTEGSVDITKRSGQIMSQVIEIEVVEQLMAGEPKNLGLDVSVGNRYPYDDRIAPEGKLTHGAYDVNVHVIDTNDRPLYQYSTKVTL